MQINRYSVKTPRTDMEQTRKLIDRVGWTGESILRIWSPSEHVSFGRRNVLADNYEQAVAAAKDRGYPTIV